jgi:hypothetical protein
MQSSVESTCTSRCFNCIVYMASMVNGGYVRIWKEVVVAYFIVCYTNILLETLKNISEKFSHVISMLVFLVATPFGRRNV